MKLVEALNALRRAPVDGEPFRVALACGFTPLHLQTFLAAHLLEREPGRRVSVEVGLFGDAVGNLERLDPSGLEAAVAAIEWSDLDPRLDLRQRGGWRPRDLPDILATATARAGRIEAALARLAGSIPVVLSLPTLPLPPVSYLPGHQAGEFDLELRAAALRMAARAAGTARARVVSPQRLDRASPPDARLDVASALAAGFPYKVPHADALAALIAALVLPVAPKKGLITDLDDTLWKGIVGEVGPAGVAWDLDRKAQKHGLYQQMLVALAEAGVLVAVASKNDPAVVAEALEHDELGPLARAAFPLEVSWGPKSQAVGRILRAWNVGADSVVFVDDSPMELAEVRAAHPEVECLLFPSGDDTAAYAFLEGLRDLFGKPRVSADDAIRLESLRRAAEIPRGDGPGDVPEDFLGSADAELTIDAAKSPPDPRALELINKTNQFNLNGRRITEAAWAALLDDPRSALMLVGYRDKFGPLGSIAALAGRLDGETFHLDAWVMSCRAFSRRIEHACLALLFERLGPAEVALDFAPTPKNGPLREFLAALRGSEPDGPFRLARADFFERCPTLHHRIKDQSHA
jgi:FkbH-like protein